jgi:nitroreductase
MLFGMGVIMEADEAAEYMEKEKESDTFKRNAAIVIAIFAMLLAITGLGGGNATKEAINENIAASNAFNFFQAKNMRQTSLTLAANEIELAWSAGNLSDDAKAALKTKLDDYRKTIQRYESEPATGEGKKELLEQAREHAANRDRALRQDPYFDYSQALLQIAIVLISVSIVAELMWLAAIGGALGIIGGLLMVNGYLLLVDIPGIG